MDQSKTNDALFEEAMQANRSDVLNAPPFEGVFGFSVPPEYMTIEVLSEWRASTEYQRFSQLSKAVSLGGDLTAEEREDLLEDHGGVDSVNAAMKSAVADFIHRRERERLVKEEAESTARGNMPTLLEALLSGEVGWRACTVCRGTRKVGAGEDCACVKGPRPGMERFADPRLPAPVVTPPVSKEAVPASVRLSGQSCNRHDDCGAAEASAALRGVAPRYGPNSTRIDHCHDDTCEDCFGC